MRSFVSRGETEKADPGSANVENGSRECIDNLNKVLAENSQFFSENPTIYAEKEAIKEKLFKLINDECGNIENDRKNSEEILEKIEKGEIKEKTEILNSKNELNEQNEKENNKIELSNKKGKKLDFELNTKNGKNVCFGNVMHTSSSTEEDNPEKNEGNKEKTLPKAEEILPEEKSPFLCISDEYNEEEEEKQYKPSKQQPARLVVTPIPSKQNGQTVKRSPIVLVRKSPVNSPVKSSDMKKSIPLPIPVPNKPQNTEEVQKEEQIVEKEKSDLLDKGEPWKVKAKADSETKALVRKIFNSDDFLQMQRKKETGEKIDHFKAPNAARMQRAFSQDYISLIEDLLGEVILTTDIALISYEQFLDNIEKLLVAIPSMKETSYTTELYERSEQIRDDAEVKALIRIADDIFTSQMTDILGI